LATGGTHCCRWEHFPDYREDVLKETVMKVSEKLTKRAQVVALLKNVRFTTQAHTHLSVHIQMDEHDSQVVKMHEPYAFTRYLDGWELLPSRKCVALRNSLDWFYSYDQDHEGIERDLMVG